ncbi:dihydropteroate synthase DHPS [Nitrosococcus halophilus Nc 4]|uniref:Dihydropteroate synthase DHPS n=1 Tax=Nitrosococcus halophilus (strain Nc4) TaxID=472759 RepID=D5C440_NITHN|nr:DUF6513 domain-containing protein [Nitrosococcus halophilus]ADE13228.1 dihydropteroate synthase DHPS [Nitrosococcus halophilus Nc 4]
MREHILFLTGKLAEPSLCKILKAMEPVDFDYTVKQLGLSVAALMTAEMVERRLTETGEATRILVPGRCRGDLEKLSKKLGLPVERGPNELKDLPAYFGRSGPAPDLSRYKVCLFAEIVDAPQQSVQGILDRAAYYRSCGADVIDLGFLPSEPFDHLEEAIQALKAEGYCLSADSLEPEDLIRAGKAGVDYLLSLTEKTLYIADEVGSTPILVPAARGDLPSLERAMESLDKQGRAWLADPILEPIHFGFMDSLARYHELRRRYPQAPLLMGVGNLTELTDADTTGINAILFGIISELGISAILTTEVSSHARRAVREADLARRIMYAARENNALPQNIDDGLLCLHERRPFPDSSKEIAELAARVRDPSYRIRISQEGIHIFNRDGIHRAQDPFDLFPHLAVAGDAGHAFYLGIELARAQIAWQLGKRYSQDEELDWGCAYEQETEDLMEQKPPGTTLQNSKRGEGNGKA